MDVEVLRPAIKFLEKNKSFYFLTDSRIDNFLEDKDVKISLISETNKVEIPFSQPRKIIGFLFANVFCSGNTVIVWNIKNFVSYVLHRLGRDYNLDFQSHLIDLCLGERFIGKEDPMPPTTLQEAKKRTLSVLDKKVFSLHKNIHLPLATRSISRIETFGIVDQSLRRKKYCFYEIEGQKNGRLNSKRLSPLFFNPHILNDQEKETLVPGLDKDFVVFDFHAMEVNILGWLSKDPKLIKIMESGKDAYEIISKLCSVNDRTLVKNTFLPFAYGASTATLNDNLGLDTKMILDAYKANFKTCFEWLENQQEEAKKNGYSTDFFGRTRTHEKDFYKARNSSIQGPAAIVCQEKLIKFNKTVLMFVHDAFVLGLPKEDVYCQIVECVNELEKESDLCKGLKLKVGVRKGNKLNNLQEFNL